MNTMRDLLQKYPLGYEGYQMEKGLVNGGKSKKELDKYLRDPYL